MKTHPLIAGAAIAVILGLQGYTLKNVVALQVNVATLSQRLDDALALTPLRLSLNQKPKDKNE